MNKTSISSKRILTLVMWFFIFFALIPLEPPQIAKADAAPPPDPTVGGVGPYQPIKTHVQMISETVFIDVPRSPADVQEPKQIKVNASFTMRNQGGTKEHMQVIFPLTRLGYDWNPEPAIYRVRLSSFVAKVNGQSVPITQITTQPEISADGTLHGFYPEVLWAAFDVTFPVHKTVLLQVEYEMINENGVQGEGFTGISYILETGAGWYGKILSANIILRLPYDVEEEAIRYANPGYVISGREMHWNLKNSETTREDNLEVGVIHVDVWQEILDLRTRIKQNPADADAWAELGDWYQIFAVFFPNREQGNLPYFSINQRLANLTLEARQKVVALRPKWGNAHFRLAQILWFTNPTVEEKFGPSATKREFLQPDDPAIQEVLHELDLAWLYGFNGNVEDWNILQFQELINNSVTGLTLTSHATATSTLLTIPTNTAFPTVIPTLATTVSPTLISTITPTLIPTQTPSSISNSLLIPAVATIAVGIGLLVYVMKLKRER